MRRHHGRVLSPYAGRVATPLSADVTLVRSFDSQINPSRPVRQSPLATSQIQGMPLDLIDRIRSFPLFQSAPDTFLAEIGLLLKPQMHSPNDYILTEGDDAKAMYWLVRGAVAVTSRDGESTFAELKPGAFFGEIGLLMERPRTATVIARTRCLVFVLKKEDLQRILPHYPEIEQIIREEALERLTQLEKKKEQSHIGSDSLSTSGRRGSKRARDVVGDGFDSYDNFYNANGASKRRKSPSPGTNEVSSASVLGKGLVNIRATLKELPLFASLPQDMLHFLGLNAQPLSFGPFTDIIKQDTLGREVYFLVRGDVEVLDERQDHTSHLSPNKQANGTPKPAHVKARLRPGQYFGEVASLSLVDRRTATVRSVSEVECLMISENVLTEFWNRCPVRVRLQMEQTARQRLQSSSSQNDVIMGDADFAPDIHDLVIGESKEKIDKRAKRVPAAARVTFSDTEISSIHPSRDPEDSSVLEPLDPDPYSSLGLDKVRSRSRRGSLAPISPEEIVIDPQKRLASRPSPTKTTPNSSLNYRAITPPTTIDQKYSGFSTPEQSSPVTPSKISIRAPKASDRGSLPEKILCQIFQYFDLHELMHFRRVSLHWQHLLTHSPDLFYNLDLSYYNRKITDEALTNRICPFVGARPRIIDVSNCFHITDEGFSSLANLCGANVTVWRMKSVWDVTAPAILEMSNKARALREVDLSNCRKVSDTLLARIVGWVVPGHSSAQNHRSKSFTNPRPPLNTKVSHSNSLSSNPSPPPGTVFGCPDLSSITLSYCKHITDRTMHHIANHAAKRIEMMDLTRCTTITDSGFQYWSHVRFEKLRKLCLADCTYLSDQSIVWLVNGAGTGLRELDLSFCCALSDTATEVLALGCPNLTHLNLSFCGSAVSDASLRSIGLHLTALKKIAVRGCVRVTGVGVESVIDGCHKLQVFDVSQCKNLQPWLDSGGVERWRSIGRDIRFEVVSSGSKLVRIEEDSPT